MAQQPTERTRSRRSRRRAEIIETASRLAEERGGPTFTTEELAHAADVSQASLFYYFRGGRQEIETALALRESWIFFERVKRAAEQTTDGVEALLSLVRECEAALNEDETRVMGFMEGMMRGPWPEELIQEHIAAVNELISVVEARLRVDKEAGLLADEVGDLRRYTSMVLALVVGQVVQALMIKASGGTSVHGRADSFGDLIALLQRGTRAPPAARPAKVRSSSTRRKRS